MADEAAGAQTQAAPVSGATAATSSDNATAGGYTVGGAGDTTARAEIDTLVSDLGLNPAQFADVADVAAARVKAQTIIDMNMQQGRTVLQQMQQGAPQQQVNSGGTTPLTQQTNTGAVVDTAQFSAKPLNLHGIDETDPVALLAKDLHQQATQAYHVANQATAKLVEIEKRNAVQAYHSREAEIERAFDNLKDPLFGSGRSRTPVQEATRKEARTLADYALASAIQSGQPEPTIEARIKQAAFAYRSQRPGSGAAPTQTTGTGLNISSPQAGAGVPKMGIHERWADHPEMKRVLGM